MGNNRIKYLVKFVTEESHANDLLDGKLFMRPSRYFRSLESKNLDHRRGDQTEGAIFADARGTAVNYLGIFQNDDLPIFCTYTVYENDIADNRIAISKKVVEEFNCEQGFAVLIDYLGFKQDLEKIKEKQYHYGDLIEYPKLKKKGYTLRWDNHPETVTQDEEIQIACTGPKIPQCHE